MKKYLRSSMIFIFDLQNKKIVNLYRREGVAKISNFQK